MVVQPVIRCRRLGCGIQAAPPERMDQRASIAPARRPLARRSSSSRSCCSNGRHKPDHRSTSVARKMGPIWQVDAISDASLPRTVTSSPPLATISPSGSVSCSRLRLALGGRPPDSEGQQPSHAPRYGKSGAGCPLAGQLSSPPALSTVAEQSRLVRSLRSTSTATARSGLGGGAGHGSGMCRTIDAAGPGAAVGRRRTGLSRGVSDARQPSQPLPRGLSRRGGPPPRATPLPALGRPAGRGRPSRSRRLARDR
jgi:hypothetical protein